MTFKLYCIRFFFFSLIHSRLASLFLAICLSFIRLVRVQYDCCCCCWFYSRPYPLNDFIHIGWDRHLVMIAVCGCLCVCLILIILFILKWYSGKSIIVRIKFSYIGLNARLWIIDFVKIKCESIKWNQSEKKPRKYTHRK